MGVRIAGIEDLGFCILGLIRLRFNTRQLAAGSFIFLKIMTRRSMQSFAASLDYSYLNFAPK